MQKIFLENIIDYVGVVCACGKLDLVQCCDKFIKPYNIGVLRSRPYFVSTLQTRTPSLILGWSILKILTVCLHIIFL